MAAGTPCSIVELVAKVLLTVATVALWSALARRRREHVRLDAALRVYLRYLLGFTVAIYGLAKMVEGQFPIPGPGRMLDRIGELSPMGLLWTFMGHSPGYCAFTGLAELLGGVLLFYRHTTKAGALMIVAVMANVVTLNFCYDVPVKIFSTHLLLIAGFLLLPDLGRLANFFLFNRPIPLVPLRPPFGSPAFQRWYTRLKPIVLAAILVGSAVVMSVAGTPLSEGQPGELAGTWDVETFTRDSQVHPPLFTDRLRWRFLAVDHRGNTTVRFADETTDHFDISAVDGRVSFASAFRGRAVGDFDYHLSDRDHVALVGKLDNIDVRMTLRRHGSWLLPTRGFHWVSEAPFNE
jgi:uncharacterized membrane protein YphA (DoxX/SURF4 family)